MTGPQQGPQQGGWPGPVWPGPGPQPPSWPGPPPAPKPERGPRPDDVTLSVQLWIFVIIASVVARVAEAFSVRGSTELRRAYDEARKTEGFNLDKSPGLETFEKFDTTLFVMALVITALVAIGVAVLVYLNWLGQSWTRVALQLVAGFVVMLGIWAFQTDQATVAVPSILAAVAVVGAVIAGNSREALAYFKPGTAA
ncbi:MULTISPECIES: hypothetical protein [Tsukamurella]|uniref:Uncharacterized protein n=1 Tax=Tsukamurella strandjordii TaxID=147577 RepID=A0AA90SFN1_9ACTN|nr:MULTISPECIES: hypothetical protein [Tsukamurella]MDP0396774.1 hypothetical protein [Tsukamurella strandjordii]